MENVFLSFVPYAAIFAFFYIIAAIAMIKYGPSNKDDEEWKTEKSNTMFSAFTTAMSFSIMFCAYRCLTADDLGIADRIFVLAWGIWSLFTLVAKHTGK